MYTNSINDFSCFTGDSGGGISRDDFIDKVASGILGKLPVEYDMDIIRKNFGVQISPTTVVLLQELERFNVLIKKMKVSLSTLRRVSAEMFMLMQSVVLQLPYCDKICQSRIGLISHLRVHN